MYVNKRAMYHLKEGLELLKSGRAHQARYFLQVAIEMIERKQQSDAETGQAA
jgi:hypothetical protein